ncbi:hypothetical protein ACIBSV_46860 [Embleya sp. NPDC050154]|uniref:hypothetical protein n=1 Tax=Embleya sp. NPDC050154 TaxID=3363988 RepID=UPI003787F1DE
MSERTPDEARAALFRILAARARVAAAQFELAAEVASATASMRECATAIQRSYDAEVAAHPDLAELDVQLDSYYGGTT